MIAGAGKKSNQTAMNGPGMPSRQEGGPKVIENYPIIEKKQYSGHHLERTDSQDPTSVSGLLMKIYQFCYQLEKICALLKLVDSGEKQLQPAQRWPVNRPLAPPGGQSLPIRPDGSVRFYDSSGKPLADVTVEIADTPESQATGLMGRTGLDDTTGMLFIFPQARNVSFWMRDTPTPLDIIFVSSEGVITNIASGTQPNSDTSYASKGPVQYVVEVPAFFCQRHGLKEGSRLVFQRSGV